MVDSPGNRIQGCDVVLISNGFQIEYETGFANGLARNGRRPLLVCSDLMTRERLDSGVQTINLRGSQRPDRSVLQKARNILGYWMRLRSLLRGQSASTVHVIGLFTLPSALVALLEALVLRLVVRRFVLTVHNLVPHDADGTFNRSVYRLIYRLPHTLVVHTNRMQARLCAEFGVSTNRVLVMEHGIDRLAHRESADPGWLSNTLALPPGRPIVLFFGSVAPYKGLDALVDALLESPGNEAWLLVIAGRCRDPALRRKLTPAIASLVAQGRARWVDGFIPEADVLNYFHGADLLVMPYRAIDQSGVVFMAMSCGLPVVATDVGSLGEVVPLTDGRVVPLGDPKALLQGIDEALAAIAGTDRSSRVLRAEQFLWSNTVRSVLPAYGGQP